MKEAIEKAQEELKRADHLFYVSLKYTKTVSKSTLPLICFTKIC